ncbi:Thioredoxin [Arboricoccus pini]|uniref:Thioredoxin n=1 Tax=Arboricoccus pini TaxID=1963835 RepID=A0A212RDW1_9PROT|nr:DsbA family protein [Arboricoccus pini]SNB70437.1 Thioredoxin [Arboricoccus pini]
MLVNRRRLSLTTAGLLGGVGLFSLGGHAATAQTPPAANPPATTTPPAAATPPAAKVEDHPLGRDDAPVTVIEYSSLTCPHCAEFQDTTFDAFKARYIDTGKVKFIQRDFPLDRLALSASVIAHCAGDRYPLFVDVMFKNQRRWVLAEDPQAALKQLAMAGGLDATRIDACLADQALTDAVLQSRLKAQSEFKVDSTPTFIINGKGYPGARSIDEFAKIIDPLLG